MKASPKALLSVGVCVGVCVDGERERACSVCACVCVCVCVCVCARARVCVDKWDTHAVDVLTFPSDIIARGLPAPTVEYTIR